MNNNIAKNMNRVFSIISLASILLTLTGCEEIRHIPPPMEMPDGLIFEAENPTYPLEGQTKELVVTFDPNKYTPSRDWKFKTVSIKNDNTND